MENLIRTKEDFWNIAFMAIFLLIVVIASALLHARSIVLGVSELFMLTLASFRIIRLLTYDKIMEFLRSYFRSSEKPLHATISSLLVCPWCTGIWTTLGVVVLYLSIPASQLFLIILAIAWLASLLQIIANRFIRESERAHAEKEVLEKELRK